MRYLFLDSFTLTACGGVSGVRDQLGVTKDSPDEFAVVRRAPLEIPPNVFTQGTLPTPQPGAPRPQEKAPAIAAKTALFGSLLKSRKPALRRMPSWQKPVQKLPIRRSASIINQETASLHDRNKPVAERLLGIGGDANLASATVVDAKAERQRILTAIQDGRSITDGDTPSIEE